MRPRALHRLLVPLALLVSACASPATGAVKQPAQPASGPGGSDYAHAAWRVSSGGTGADAWYAFEPVRPRPRTAPLAVITHGYFEYSGYASLHELIRHTVRTGSVVIYPRWQTGLAAPCPGPYDIEPCMASEVAGIRGALKHLRSGRGRVRPQRDRTSYFGFSFGGILTANLANRHRALGLPRPRAIFLEDPHDGGRNGAGETALDDTLTGIPPDTKVQCHSSADGVIAEKPGSSCNALFPKLGHIPARNKDLVLTVPDRHGTPALQAGHGVCAAARGQADAYDWGFCWKVWDALRSPTTSDDRYALGATPEHRSNGRWSDGTPIARLRVRDAAPIAP